MNLGSLTADEQRNLESEQKTADANDHEYVGGISRMFPEPLILADIPTATDSPREYRGGIVERSTDGTAISWRGGFQSSGATAIRLHLTGVELPPGAAAFVSDGQQQMFGPYFTTDDQDREDFWTHEIGGDTIFLEVLVPTTAPLGDVRLIADEVAHMVDADPAEDVANENQQPEESESEFDERIVRAAAKTPYVDVACMKDEELDPLRPALNAAAHIRYHKAPKSKYWGLCSAALISDKRPNGKPSGALYLLTANHCVSNDYRAKHLVAYWKYKRASCGTAAPSLKKLEQNLGAALLKTRAANDFAFIRLKGPAPKNAYWFGWSSEPAPVGTTLYRIHHPRGFPQKFQKSQIDAQRKCSSRPPYEYHYSKRARGSTAKGSSGSVVFSIREPAVPGKKKYQAQGQLWGWCNGRNIDGEFNRTYPYVKEWLLPKQ